MTGEIDRRRRYSTVLLLALFFVALFVLHTPLLRLPYFWDESGYYVPAARDLLLHAELIPRSTPSNAHPPLVMAYLALAWKLLGYSPVVTRTAILGIAAFSLLGIFRLAQRVANTEVALASILCTALYPVFFAQSSLAHLDLAAAGLTFWALLAYVEDRRWTAALWFSLAVLAKETAILAPLALFAWELLAAALTSEEHRFKGRGKILDSYQGMPSGIPQPPENGSGFSRWESPPTTMPVGFYSSFPSSHSPSGTPSITRAPDSFSATRNSSATTYKQRCSRSVSCSHSDYACGKSSDISIFPSSPWPACWPCGFRPSATTAKNARGSRCTYSSPSSQSLPLT